MVTNWLAFSSDVALDPLLKISTYATGILGLLILIHSARLHGRKFDSVRICTDLTAFICAISALLVFLCPAAPTDPGAVVIVDLLYCGLLVAVVQFCDSYMFYSRLLAVQKVEVWQKVVIISYVFIVLIFTWLPTYTIVPFFYDTNSLEYSNISPILAQIYSFGTVFYNSLFTYRFIRIFLNISQRIMHASADNNALSGGGGGVGGEDNHSQIQGPTSQGGNVSSVGHGTGESLLTNGATSGGHHHLAGRAGGGGFHGNSEMKEETKGHGSLSPVAPYNNSNTNNSSTAALSRPPEAVGRNQPHHNLPPPRPSSRPQSSAQLAEYAANGDVAHEDIYEPRVISKIKLIALKSMAHATISTFAAFFYAFGPVVGSYYWTAIVLLGMHISFNMKIERYFSRCFPDHKITAMTRHDREVNAIVRARRNNHLIQQQR